MSKTFTQTIPEGEEPKIRLLYKIQAMSFFDDSAESVAHPGEHKAYMNRLGAVSVKADNGKLLGVLPKEMKWISGKPSHWCLGDGNTYHIKPYEGDWTLEAFEKEAQNA